ncbi:unnamed protein product [Closterium sp. NIES-54]
MIPLPGSTEPEGAEPGGTKLEGAESGGAEPRGTASIGGPADASPRLSPRREPLSPQQLREWFAQCIRARSGATRAGVSAAGGTGAGGAGASSTRGAGAAGPRGARTSGTGAAGADPGAIGAGAGGAGAGGPGAGHTMQRHPFFVPPPLTSLPPPDSVLRQPNSPLPAPSLYAEQTESLIECLPLPSPLATSLPDVPDPEYHLACAASLTVPRLLSTIVTDLSFESTTASALVAELVDFAAACRLDYSTSLVAESEFDCPPSVGGECALGTNVLEGRQEDFECLAAVVPHLVAMVLALEGDPDAPDIPTPRSYAEAITLHEASRDYELHSLDFSTYFLQGSLHEEIWLRRPPGFTGSFSAGTQWSLRRPVYGLRQAPHDWHDTLRTTLAALGFAPSTADPSLFLRTNTSLPPFYVLVYVDDLVFATADTEALTLVKSELQKRHTCTDLGDLCSYLGMQIT